MKVGADLIWQLQGEPLGSVVEQALQGARDTVAPTRFAHVVNLFLRDNELPADQYETVAAIGRAQRTSEAPSIAVFVTDAHDHDRILALTTPLVTHVHVIVGTFAGTMPQAAEILQSAHGSLQPSDHVVFTNADICPVPAFYDAITQLLTAGVDSLVINRRSTFGFWPGETNAGLAAFALGAAHPGFDCFVFPSAKIDHMAASDSVVGSPYVMLSLLLNLVALSEPLMVLTDAHLTYHFGDDRAWSADGRNELVDRNLDAAIAVRDGHRGAAAERLQAFFTAFDNWEPSTIPRG